jgi:phosphonate transport system substrate-binding protein
MYRLTAMLAVLAVLLTGCGAAADEEELVIGGIPDQDVAVLEKRFGGLADYLSAELGIPVRYQPSIDYSAVVTAFANGDVQLGWFGGLTGVQARLETPGAQAVAQRPIDTEFRSVFIVRAGDPAQRIQDLAGHTFTFGSQSSTSGHLMPRHFLTQAGIDPSADFDGRPGYSGSHDKTWKLVEAGSFEAGVLNASVWDEAVGQGQVNTGQVRELARTPPYYDYHWMAHPDIDKTYGPGTTDRLLQALLRMDQTGPEAQRVLELFNDDEFIPTKNANYDTIEQVARSLGLVGG